MQRHIDVLLQNLKSHLTEMSGLVEFMLADAIRILVDRDTSVVPKIRKHEDQVNMMQIEIDESCLTLIALHQPTASDLRFIMGASKTVGDLERVADQALNIARKAEHLLKEPPLKEWDILPKMAEITREMLKGSLHAYVHRDVDKARAVLMSDDKVDDFKKQILVELTEMMKKDAAIVSRALDVIMIAHNLERIGDHATNIAENTIFIAEGKDVRHHAQDI